MEGAIDEDDGSAMLQDDSMKDGGRNVDRRVDLIAVDVKSFGCLLCTSGKWS